MGSILSRRADEREKSSLPLHIHHLLLHHEITRVINLTRMPLKSLCSPNSYALQIAAAMGNILSPREDESEEEEEESVPVPLLHEEIIRDEILTRLPVESLVRFRCVCKEWKSLLSCDANFIKSHLTRTLNDRKRDSIIFKGSPWTRWFKKKKESHHPPLSEKLELAGSVNGLVCVYLRSYIEIGIWNPATNHYKYIPSPPQLLSKGDIFDTSIGFGFDPIDNDYKVIYVNALVNGTLVARVYSCNAASWGNNLITSPVRSRAVIYRRTVVVNGRPYWCNCFGVSPEHRYLISFDVGRQVFKLLPAIDFVDLRANYYVLVNLKESLAVIVLKKSSNYDSLLQPVDVYILDETSPDCAWSKSYTIFPITITRGMKFLQCFWNGDLLFYDYKEDDIKLVCIDPEKHQVNRFRSLPSPLQIGFCFSYGFGYIDSLVYVKGMTQIQANTDASDILFIE